MYLILPISAFSLYFLIYTKKDNKYFFKRRDKVYLVLFFTIATLIMSFRSVSVGVDTYGYSIHYDQVVATNWKYIFTNLDGIEFRGREIGYVILEKIIGTLTNDYYVFQFVVSTIYCFSMMEFLKDNVDSKIILTTVFLGSGLYLLAFNLSRQMLAVALTSLCWKNLTQGKKVKAGILLGIAVTFHVSSIVFAIAFILYAVRKHKFLLYASLIIGIITAVNYSFVIRFISSYITAYSTYIKNDREVIEIGTSIILYCIIIILAIYILTKIDSNNTERIYAAFSLAYVACVFIGLSFNYFDRIGYCQVFFANSYRMK